MELAFGTSESPFKMKAFQQHFHVVLFIMLYKTILTFNSVDETLTCDHSNESYEAALSCDAVYFSTVFKRKSLASFLLLPWTF